LLKENLEKSWKRIERKIRKIGGKIWNL